MAFYINFTFLISNQVQECHLAEDNIFIKHVTSMSFLTSKCLYTKLYFI